MDENNNDNVVKEPKSSKKAKKITNSILMFGGLLVSLVAVIAIPLALNSNKDIKRDRYLDDGVDLNIQTKKEIKEIVKDKEYDFDFNQEEKDIKNNVFNDDFRILKTSNSFIQKLPIIDHETTPSFNKNDNFKKFYEKWKIQNNGKGRKSVSTTSETIVNSFDFLKFLKDYYKEKNALTEEKISNMLKASHLLDLELIKNNFTYVIEREKQYLYKDLKAKIIAVNIREFIKKCIDGLREFGAKNNINNILNKAIIKQATFSTKMTIDPITHEIKHFTFNSKINISLKNE
ncbi:Uncharacterised protein [Metamycoplasma arthritidis]|uniref:Hypothetical membrane protein n=1 Tax=Metamycoplasma arthritidis (strain 158L3-1) TaxID=243272 RepID=B3PND0_META1|nr:hypothetical protein [Metamycoplasma arthritidis]ACF07532.1 hypothetical membrane protein [Metamycoplasma arthritidis 158L3-1]VEU79040.1 Uncharacterised protein [Metamycoplasma arthritidis]